MFARAINYAINRAELARLFGSEATPTCQWLAPYVQGFERHCPYTLDPTANGIWHAPNVALAQRLVAVSGTRGTPITIYDGGTFNADDNPAGQYLAQVFRRLGYPTRWVSGIEAQERFADSRDKQQALLTVDAPEYLSASQMLRAELSCQQYIPDSPNNGNYSEYCSPKLDHLMNGALAAEGENSPAATRLWAQADRFATGQALEVPLVTPTSVGFVSARVGNYEFSQQYGPMVDQMWVR
jgi:peptide/nickel transport system substrate-binding protein